MLAIKYEEVNEVLLNFKRMHQILRNFFLVFFLLFIEKLQENNIKR